MYNGNYKKILFILFLILNLLCSISFSYSQNNINNIIKNKLEISLENIKIKNSNLSNFETCIKEKEFLQKLYDKVNKIYTKFRTKRDIYKTLITIKKLSLEKKDKIICQNNIGGGDFWLENKIEGNFNKNYSYNYSKTKNIKHSIRENTEATEIEGNFYKIGGQRFLFEQYNFYNGIPANQKNKYINIAKKEYPNTKIFYNKEKGKYKIIMVKKEHIKYVGDYNLNYNSLNKIITYNLEKSKKLGINIINKVLYSEGDTIYKSAIFEEEGKLYYFINYGEVSYTTIPNDMEEKSQYLTAVYYAQGGKYIYRKGNKFYILTGDLKVFPIGYKSLYRNINLKKLGSLLENSFFWTAKSGYDYKVEDMYDIIKYSKKFNNKKLSQLYEDMKNIMKYNSTIKQLLNKENWGDNQIQNYVNQNKKIMKVFNIFETMKNKEGVCETFSEILSIVSLFNGLDSNVLVGTAIKGNYGHQISVIEGYYYDLTFDLGYQKIKYFAMSRDLVDEYFIERKKED